MANRVVKSVYFNTPADVDLLADLEYEAKQQGMSLSAYLLALIKRGYERTEEGSGRVLTKLDQILNVVSTLQVVQVKDIVEIEVDKEEGIGLAEGIVKGNW